MVAKFPSSRSLSVGTFWKAPTGSASVVGDDAKSRGLCRVDDDTIEVDVVGELTPVMARLPGGASVRQPDEEGYDVHGSIPIRPWDVTFVDCRKGPRESNALGMFEGNDHSHQVVRPVWAVVGAHVRGRDRFTGFRMRVTGLEEWAQTPGFQQTMTMGGTVATSLSHTGQPPMTTPFLLFGESGSLDVDTMATVPEIDVHGGQIRRANRIGLTGLSGWTLEEAMTSFVLPIQTLMTLLTGASARVLTVEVQVGDRWCEVYGRYIDGVLDDAPVKLEMLLPANRLTLDHIATWIRVARDLSPVPQVVAAGISGEFATVDTQALVMATAVESLDRRMRPRVFEFEPDVIAEGARLIEEAAIDAELREKIVGAVRKYMGEPSMPKRLQVLAQHVGLAAPDCVGRANRWKRAVTDVRNDGAHGLKGERPPDPGTMNRPTADAAGNSGSSPQEDANDLARVHTLVLSIRWALRIRVLQACGASDEVLSEALANFSEYGKDRFGWKHYWPEIYLDVSTNG